MAYTAEQIARGIEKAKAAGDTEAVNELQALLSSVSPAPAAPAPQPQKVTPLRPDRENTSAPTPYGLGAGAVPQAPQAMSAGLVRYGVPVGVGFATGGPAGGIMGLGRAMIPGAVSGFLSEMAAQDIEGKYPFFTEGMMEAGAAGVEASMPVFRITSGAKPAVASFLRTAAGNVGLTEFADYARTGEFRLPDKTAKEIAASWAVPIGVASLAGIGGKAQGMSQGIERAEEISKSRYGGAVMLSEVFPEMTGFELRRLKNGNKFAFNALRDLDANLGDTIAKAYADVPEQAVVAKKVAAMYDAINPVREQARALRDQATALADEYEKAKVLGRADAQKLRDELEVVQANALKTRTLYEDGLKRIFGNQLPSIDSVAAGTRQKLLADTAELAKRSVGESLTALYQKAGVGLNDPVVSLSEVTEEIRRRAGKGGPLEGNLARREIVDAVTSAFGDSREMTLEAYRRFQSDVAEELVRKGKDPKAANRIAGGAYDAMRAAADKTMARAYPDRFPAFKQAQDAAALHFAAKEADAIKFVAKGDSEGLLNAITTYGAGRVLSELDAYAKAIGEVSNLAAGAGADPVRLKAAQTFKDDVFTLIRDGLIDRATVRDTGLTDMAQAVDFGKLASSMHELKTKGIDLGLVGVSADDVARLAKLNAKEVKTPLSKADLDEFLQLIPDIGADAAAKRVTFRKLVANSLIANGTRSKAEALRKQQQFAREAGIKADEAEAIFQKAASDPLIQFFDTNKTSMFLDADPVKNGRWVNQIVTGNSPTFVGEFADALRASGKKDVLEEIGKAAEFSVLDSFRKAFTESGSKLDLDDITHTFKGQDQVAKNKRASLQKLIGLERYNVLARDFVEPAAKILETRTKLGMPVGQSLLEFQSLMAAKGLAEQKATAAVVFSNAVRRVWENFQDKNYNLLYGLILEPRNNAALRRFGYDIDRYAAASPTNAALVRLLRTKDEQAKQQP